MLKFSDKLLVTLLVESGERLNPYHYLFEYDKESLSLEKEITNVDSIAFKLRFGLIPRIYFIVSGSIIEKNVKQTASNQPIDQLFPYLSEDQFFNYKTEAQNDIIYSFIRKEEFQKAISVIGESEWLADKILFNYSVITNHPEFPVVGEGEETQFSGFVVSRSVEGELKVTPKTDELNESDACRKGLAYSAAINYITGDTEERAWKEYETNEVLVKSEHRTKVLKAVRFYLLPAVALYVIISLVGLYFQSQNNGLKARSTILNSKLTANQDSIKTLDNLSNEVLNFTEQSLSQAVVIDRIMAAKPDGLKVTLAEVYYTDGYKKDEFNFNDDQLSEDFVLIKGQTNTPELNAIWFNNIQKLNWVDKIDDYHLEFNSRKGYNIFSFKVKVN
ncbi:hypothetical protein [Mangrovivirga cuniculi]|uniref:Uncharacterized protein n=1 Tax=Mangrovivirga cuniculi TaxID=2715131 RepID=A0A4D7JBK8_9BACT|nr:hypothetical protein [Mangrovivirga cuniculi]QCK13769.1 hypothetical protein DCC35_02850 [Mangrovivirga cuniculi]